MMESMYLCSMPGFWIGVGRLLDFGKSYDLYNEAANGNQADGLGSFVDWQMVSQDMWQAIVCYEQEVEPTEVNRREIQVACR